MILGNFTAMRFIRNVKKKLYRNNDCRVAPACRIANNLIDLSS